MPKKSDRTEHESAMSSLLPDVSLDKESREDSEAELENSRSKEEKNYSSADSSSQNSTAEDPDEGNGRSSSSKSSRDPYRDDNGVSVFPDQRPELKQKLGPYVSDEVSEALEEVYLLLRRTHGKGANKSLIVEAALRYFLNDCIERGEESEVSKWMDRVVGGSE